MLRLSFVILVALIGLSSAANIEDVVCRDDEGNPVDWFIMYKLPATSSSAHTITTGLGYYYITSKTAADPPRHTRKSRHTPSGHESNIEITEIHSLEEQERFLKGTNKEDRKDSYGLEPNQSQKGNNRGLLHTRTKTSFGDKTPSSAKLSSKSPPSLGNDQPAGWKLSPHLISDKESMLMRTLSVLYDESKDDNDLEHINYVLYNDAPPPPNERDSNSRAHAKGVFMIEDETQNGIWITHSIPKFPPPRHSNLFFEPNVKRNGQNIMCISYTLLSAGSAIVDHLSNMNPMIYDSHITKELESLLPNIDDLPFEDRRYWRMRREPTLAQGIKTRGGKMMQLFSKSSSFKHDIYSAFIDEDLKSSLIVSTWRSGAGGKLNSSCPPNDYHVNNVKSMVMRNTEIEASWDWTKDHSKWAISDEKEDSMVCVADMNRMESQFKRGGGAVCFRNSITWQAYSRSIIELEPCPKD